MKIINKKNIVSLVALILICACGTVNVSYAVEIKHRIGDVSAEDTLSPFILLDDLNIHRGFLKWYGWGGGYTIEADREKFYLSSTFHFDGSQDIDAEAKARFNRGLEDVWLLGIKDESIAFDPDIREEIKLGEMVIREIEGRKNREGVGKRRLEIRFGDQHDENYKCIFCSDGFKKKAVIARLNINGRQYLLTFNQFPCGKMHFLVNKADGSGVNFEQYVQSPEEIEEMLTLQRYLDDDFMQYFDCLPGKDESDAGATINHWHNQIIKSEKGFYAGELVELEEFSFINNDSGDLKVGSLKGMRTTSRVFEAADIRTLSEYAFLYLKHLNAIKLAYNFAILNAPGGRLRFVITPRKKGPPDEYFMGVDVFQRFGPLELAGIFIESNSELFLKMREFVEADASNKEKLKAMIYTRLENVGFSEGEMKEFDQEFVAAFYDYFQSEAPGNVLSDTPPLDTFATNSMGSIIEQAI